jgi:hypothetical protein
MEKEEKMGDKQNLGWRPSFSIIVGVCWLIFLIIWFAFYATPYPWEQNFAIILASILLLFLILGGTWAMWGIRRIPEHEKEMMKAVGFRLRIMVSIILPLVAMIFLIVWFWYYAIPYSIWQNIAIILVTLLIVGGVLGSIWARWGIKHEGWSFDKQPSAYYHKDKEKKSDEEEKEEKTIKKED